MMNKILDIYLPKTDFKIFKMKEYEIIHHSLNSGKSHTLYKKYFGVSIEYERYFWKRLSYKKWNYPNVFDEKSWTFQFLGFTIIFQTVLERQIIRIPDFNFN